MGRQQTGAFYREVMIAVLGGIITAFIIWVVGLASPTVFIKGLGGVTMEDFEAFKKEVQQQTPPGQFPPSSDSTQIAQLEGQVGRIQNSLSVIGDPKNVATKDQIDVLQKQIQDLQQLMQSIDPSTLATKDDLTTISQHLAAVENKTQSIQTNNGDGATRIVAGDYLFMFNPGDGRISVHSLSNNSTILYRLLDDVHHP